MNKGSYSFRVGRFECVVIHEGMSLTPDLSYRLTELYNPANFGSMTDINLLLIKTGKQTILCDTGLGSMDPDCGNMIPNLNQLGIENGQIDIVILSHRHGDHIGVIMDSKGSPVFPNASYIMLKEE